MLGAIIGDICGSIYEGADFKQLPINLKHPRCRFTDDSVLTSAVTSAFLATETQLGNDWRDSPFLVEYYKKNLIDQILKYTKKYPRAGYGGSFIRWIYSADHMPYNSWGNGAAMRTSCCGWASRSIEEARKFAIWTAEITHNHPEGIKGAVAISECIFQLRHGEDKNAIRKIAESYYDMNFTLDDIRPTYKFDVSSQGSVPQAIEAFLEGNDFEEIIKLAISIGGDSDTIAAIAASLAELYFPIPEELREFAVLKLPEDIWNPIMLAEAKWGD